MRILVVDDNEDFANKQCEWLRGEGYEAVPAYSAEMARDLLDREFEKELINLALIDMFMEAKDSGLSLIKYIKENCLGIVSIVVTGYADVENAARCMEEGCFSYIVKGETPLDVIRQTIKKSLEHQKSLTALSRLTRGLKELRGQFIELDKKIDQTSLSLQRIEDEISLLNRPRETTGNSHP